MTRWGGIVPAARAPQGSGRCAAGLLLAGASDSRLALDAVGLSFDHRCVSSHNIHRRALATPAPQLRSSWPALAPIPVGIATPAADARMLNRLPTWLPSFAELLDDMGSPGRNPRAVAAALGVSERTIRRWIAGKAPRTARLSLWWLSRHGYSEWECEMHRRAYLPAALARAAIDEARRASRPRAALDSQSVAKQVPHGVSSLSPSGYQRTPRVKPKPYGSLREA